jgi:hypothetical protein
VATVKRLIASVTALQIRLAIVLALAAATLLDLCIVYRAKATQVATHVRVASPSALEERGPP